MTSQKRNQWDAETIEEMRALMRHDEAGSKLREAKAVAMARSGRFNSSTSINAELRRLFGVGLKDETMKRIKREFAPEPPSLRAPATDSFSSEQRLMLLEAKISETLRMSNRIFGMIGAVRHEIQRIADALGAPRDTKDLKQMRELANGTIDSDATGAAEAQS